MLRPAFPERIQRRLCQHCSASQPQRDGLCQGKTQPRPRRWGRALCILQRERGPLSGPGTSPTTQLSHTPLNVTTVSLGFPDPDGAVCSAAVLPPDATRTNWRGSYENGGSSAGSWWIETARYHTGCQFGWRGCGVKSLRCESPVFDIWTPILSVRDPDVTAPPLPPLYQVLRDVDITPTLMFEMQM